MYAIVEIAGKQFRVAKDMQIKVPHLEGDEGTKVDFDRVFMVEDDKGNVTIGKPLVGNTSVSAKIVEHGREKKIIVFKKKRRKGHQKKNGHRQGFSLIEITGIGAAKKAPVKKAAATSETAVKEKPAAKTAKAETIPAKKAPAKAKPAETKKAEIAEAKPAKKAPAKKAAAPKTAATKKPATKKEEKPAAGAAKKDVKED
jgi:large subunit ribosomal protein L21